jgi:lysophospholipase L1-like esterase
MLLLLVATVISSIIDLTHGEPVAILDDAATNQSIDARDQNPLFPTTYLAMGDSLASGVGAGNHFDRGDEQDNKRCKRFSNRYPAQAVDLPALRSLPESAFNFVACSGEKLDGIDVQRKAVSRVKIDVVTLSIGGNDFGFEEAVRNCIFGFTTAAAASCGPA